MPVAPFRYLASSFKFARLVDRWIKAGECDQMLIRRKYLVVAYLSKKCRCRCIADTTDRSNDLYVLNHHGLTCLHKSLSNPFSLLHEVLKRCVLFREYEFLGNTVGGD